MTGSDLADMLVTDPGIRRALPRLLNFERAERWRQLLTTNEWHKNIDELLMADTDELLNRVSIRNQVGQGRAAIALGLCAGAVPGSDQSGAGPGGADGRA